MPPLIILSIYSTVLALSLPAASLLLTSEPGATHNIAVRFLALHCSCLKQGFLPDTFSISRTLLGVTFLGGIPVGICIRALFSTVRGNTIPHFHKPNLTIYLGLSLFFISWFSLLGWVTGLDYITIWCQLFFVFALAVLASSLFSLFLCIPIVFTLSAVYANNTLLHLVNSPSPLQLIVMFIAGVGFITLWIKTIRQASKSPEFFFYDLATPSTAMPKSRQEQQKCKCQCGVSRRFKALNGYIGERFGERVSLIRTGNTPFAPWFVGLALAFSALMAAVSTLVFGGATAGRSLYEIAHAFYAIFVLSNPLLWLVLSLSPTRDIAYESLHPLPKRVYFRSIRYATLINIFQTWLIITIVWLLLVYAINPTGMPATWAIAAVILSLAAQFLVFSFSAWAGSFRSPIARLITFFIVGAGVGISGIILFTSDRPVSSIFAAGLLFFIIGGFIYKLASRRWLRLELGVPRQVMQQPSPRPIRSSIFVIAFFSLYPVLALWACHGPVAAAPNEDPSITLNRLYRNPPNNAAPLYEKANSLIQKPTSKWDEKRIWESSFVIPAEVPAWVAKNQPAFDLLAEASTMQNLWFDLEPLKETYTPPRNHVRFGTLHQLLRWKARLAARSRDLDEFTQCITTLNGIGRQLLQPPLLGSQMRGQGFIDTTQQCVLVPFTWENATKEQLADYTATINNCFTEVPTLTSSFIWDRRQTVWSYHLSVSKGIVQLSAALPPARMAGMFDQYKSASLKLADLPVEQQCNPNNPIRELARTQEETGFSIRHPIRSLLFTLSNNELPVIDLRVGLIAKQASSAEFVG